MFFEFESGKNYPTNTPGISACIIWIEHCEWCTKMDGYLLFPPDPGGGKARVWRRCAWDGEGKNHDPKFNLVADPSR